MTRFGKVDGSLCLHFMPTFIHDQDVAMWPLLYATTVTRYSEILCTAAPPERGHATARRPPG